jgi:hypothetical protein
LTGLGVAETNAFRLSGFLFLLGGVPLSIHGFRRATKARNDQRSMQPVLMTLSLAAGLAGLSFSLACVVGQPAELVPTYYFGALLGTLGIAATNFAGFVFSIDD